MNRFTEERRRRDFRRRVMAYILFVASAFFIAWMLTGCTTASGTGTCASCIGPYDLTLTSHREAVLGRP